jgi:hypothetical protein
MEAAVEAAVDAVPAAVDAVPAAVVAVLVDQAQCEEGMDGAKLGTLR